MVIGVHNFYVRLPQNSQNDFFCYFFAIYFCKPNNAQAQSCSKIFESHGKQKTTITLEIDSSKVNENKGQLERHFQDAVQKVADFVDQTQLFFPQGIIKIFVHPVFHHEGSPAALYHRRDVISINVPYKWLEEGKRNGEFLPKYFSRHPRYTTPLLYHELGHAIFLENAEKTNSLFAEHFQFRRTNAETAIHGTKLFEQLAKESDALKRTAIEKELAEVKVEWEQIQLEKAPEEFKKKDFTLVGLDELFADVTAIMVDKNPKAIIEIFLTQTPKGKYRDYQRNHNVSIITRNFEDIRNQRMLDEVEDVHDVFSRTRLFLYEEYLKYPYYMTGPGRSSIFEATFKTLIAVADEKFVQLSLPQQNLALMKALRENIRP